MGDVEFRAAKAAYMREWTARNRTRVNRERKARYRKNPESASHRRRLQSLRKRGGLDPETEAFVLSVLIRDPCVYCGSETALLSGQMARTTAIDHIDASGNSHWTNLANACLSCNARKGKSSLLMTLLERRLHRELLPLAEELWFIRGGTSQRRRIELGSLAD